MAWRSDGPWNTWAVVLLVQKQRLLSLAGADARQFGVVRTKLLTGTAKSHDPPAPCELLGGVSCWTGADVWRADAKVAMEEAASTECGLAYDVRGRVRRCEGLLETWVTSQLDVSNQSAEKGRGRERTTTTVGGWGSSSRTGATTSLMRSTVSTKQMPWARRRHDVRVDTEVGGCEGWSACALQAASLQTDRQSTD